MHTIGPIILNKKYYTGSEDDADCYLIVREDADRYYIMDGLDQARPAYVLFPRPMFEVLKIYNSEATAGRLLRLFLKLHGCRAFRKSRTSQEGQCI